MIDKYLKVLLLKFDHISTSLHQNKDSGSKGMISAKKIS
jgi:hypothetical protein|tara:strand:+ start:111 stop:227 length:117 start_codon:yes stop_codon:yes gene_type:complete